MFRTAILSLLGLGLAAGGPYAYFALTGNNDTFSLSKMTGAVTSTQAKNSDGDKLFGTQVLTGGSPGLSSASMGDSPLCSMDDAFRFNIGPNWVTSIWPRVMTGLGQIQLQGYRVPLITGTAEDDLAGSLTYYFDPHSQLQRIVFHGTTGNPQRLIGLMTSRFGFTRHIVNDPGVALFEVPGKGGKPPRSTLSVEVAPVIRASDPLQRYSLTMVIERPT